jgi:hypothetical protein
MEQIRQVGLILIEPNPHRNLKHYPWIEHRIETLRNSIRELGLWPGLIARPAGSRFELAFGHHRLEAARREKLKTVPLIVRELDDRAMLKFMAHENGEDYSTDFLVLLSTWEGGADFLKGDNLSVAKLLGWVNNISPNSKTVRMNPVAAACAAAHALVRAGHMHRSDFRNLSTRDARLIAVRAQERIAQLARIGDKGGHDRAQVREAQETVGKAAQIAARDAREGRVAKHDLDAEVDVNVLRVSRHGPTRKSPLFAVFVASLAKATSRVLEADGISRRLQRVEAGIDAANTEADGAALRALHHELSELVYRTQGWRRRVTPNKVVKLKSLEAGE